MSRSKSPRKKPNKYKGVDAMIKRQAAGLLVCKSGTNESAELYSDTGVRMKPSSFMAQRLPVIPLPWVTHAIVCGRDQDGAEYVTMQPVPSKDGKPRPFRAMTQDLDEKHDELMAGANELTTITYGWIASPLGQSVSEDLAHQIMSDLGAFEDLTPWEREQMIKKLEDL